MSVHIYVVRKFFLNIIAFGQMMLRHTNIKKVYTCNQCKVSEESKDMKKDSLHEIDSTFKDLVCIDHLFIDKYAILHFIHCFTRLSYGSIDTCRTAR